MIVLCRILWMVNSLPILDVELLHLNSVSSIVCDELSCHSDWFGGINLEIWAKSEEFWISQIA